MRISLPDPIERFVVGSTQAGEALETMTLQSRAYIDAPVRFKAEKMRS